MKQWCQWMATCPNSTVCNKRGCTNERSVGMMTVSETCSTEFTDKTTHTTAGDGRRESAWEGRDAGAGETAEMKPAAPFCRAV